MKNDITYEYRVFTNRLIDIEDMEVGKCTSKVVKELKPKDKVDGRFFHTYDTDEWFFCWNGELQKLNLKGDSDVNAALAEVEKLIADAKIAVNDVKKTADEAKEAASEAKTAADAASAAVESIDSKAEQSDVDELSTKVESKADSSVVKELSDKVDAINIDDYALKSEIPVVPSLDDYALKSEIPSLDDYALKSEIPSMDNYYTKEEIENKIGAINNLIGEATNITNTILA